MRILGVLDENCETSFAYVEVVPDPEVLIEDWEASFAYVEVVPDPEVLNEDWEASFVILFDQC